MTPEERAEIWLDGFSGNHDPSFRRAMIAAYVAGMSHGRGVEREAVARLLEGRADELDRWLACRMYDDAAEAREWKSERDLLRAWAARIRSGETPAA